MTSIFWFFTLFLGMTNALLLDTHAYVKKLMTVGVPEEQAEVHAEILSELFEDGIATKQDLRELELRLTNTLTLRLGGMLVAGIVIVAMLVKLL